MGGFGSRRGTLNECDGLSLSQFANGQPNGQQCHGQTADHAVDNRLRLGMIDNIAVANRAAPIGIQQIHQQSRVFQAGPESPATASVRTSRKRNPICAGSNFSRNAASISVRSVALNRNRMVVASP